MAANLPPTLREDIRAILTAPDVDLAKISAKRVRRSLAEQHPQLDTKSLKDDIDAITIPLFHEVRAEKEAADKAEAAKAKKAKQASPAVKRKRSPSPPAGASLPPAPSSAPIANGSKPAKSKGLTDEEIARLLHEEINGPGRRSRAGGASAGVGSKKKKSNGPGSSSSRGKRVAKSAAYVNDSGDETGSGANGLDDEDDDDDEEGAGGVKRKKKARRSGGGGGGGGGYNKDMQCSAALAELIGAPTSSRPQVVKALWKHIKEKDLQDPSDKRYILCDEPMQAVFATDRLHMFTMNKLLNAHLHVADEVI